LPKVLYRFCFFRRVESVINYLITFSQVARCFFMTRSVTFLSWTNIVALILYFSLYFTCFSLQYLAMRRYFYHVIDLNQWHAILVMYCSCSCIFFILYRNSPRHARRWLLV